MDFKSKHGWGIATEIIFIFMFICCLLYAVFYMNKLGMLNAEQYHKDEQKEEYENNSVDTTYEDIEDDLKAAARLYINKEYGVVGRDTLIITHAKLKDFGYIDDIKDPDRSSSTCSGYVEIERIDGETSYYPYINCYKYHTDGYVKRKDI